MHLKLTAGAVAIDKYGNIDAASTLTSMNPHRGQPGDLIICWRGKKKR